MVALYVIGGAVVCVIVSYMLEGEGQYVLPPWTSVAVAGTYREV